MRVALIVNGFPNPSRPYQGLTNLRTAKALSEVTDLRVIFLRAWKPGRRLINFSEVEYGGVPLTTLAVPQLPVRSSASFLINVTLYRSLGWLLLRSLLRNCDLIHSVDALPGIVASHWARRVGKHHVNQVIGADVNTILPGVRTTRSIAGWEKHIHGVACVSRMLETSFRSLYPHVQNVRTVYRGVDIDRFQPIGSTTGPLSDRPPVRYLFLGGFPAYPTQPYRSNTKGGETLLAVWKMAEEELISANASLLIAGPESNNNRTSGWRESLREPDRVHIADCLSPENISGYMRAADVILLPSLQEGLPNVAMEASACARPVFGSNVGGVPEVIVHEETGVLLPAGDVAAWGSALIRYARQPSLLKRMGERARLRMEALYDCNHYAPRILDLYRVALHQPLSVI
jgi:glycosyltransferase involved in cell wall biosynthesis